MLYSKKFRLILLSEILLTWVYDGTRDKIVSGYLISGAVKQGIQS